VPNRSLSIVRYCKTAHGWKRYPAAIRVKPNVVVVKGKQETFPTGRYEIRRYETVTRAGGTKSGKAVFINAGPDHHAAGLQLEQLTHEQDFQETARRTGRKVDNVFPSQRLTLEKQQVTFMADNRLKRKTDGTKLDKETLGAYEKVTLEFIKVVGKTHAEDVTKQDIQRWMDHLQARGLTHRSICNYYTNLATFLKSCKVDHKEILGKDERPHAHDKDPEAYAPEDVTRFFAACNSERDLLVFQFLLKTGAREREMCFAEWTDINWREFVFTVKNKPELGFRTKTGRSRTITCPTHTILGPAKKPPTAPD
jgi:hypothetical protein